MKKIFFLAAALLFSVALLYAEPEGKMKKAFVENFPNASNVKWHKDDNGYLVSFTQAGTPTKIVYDKNGRFISSLRYYGEKDLPTNILLAVKSKYHGKDIFGVTEFTTQTEVVYHIKLYDGKEYYNVKAYSDGSVQDGETSDNETEE
jgi:hypothetical protein